MCLGDVNVQNRQPLYHRSASEAEPVPDHVLRGAVGLQIFRVQLEGLVHKNVPPLRVRLSNESAPGSIYT